MIDSYLTVENSSSAELKNTKSRFIPNVFPVSSVLDFNIALKDFRKKYFDASHFPYAYRIGIDKNKFKISDDGEPSGSAGKPILEAINKYGLTEVGVIVVRYFGGTKLGAGGLRRAFFEAADLCLSKVKITEKLITEKLLLEFDYKLIGGVMKFIEDKKLKLSKNISDEICRLEIDVRLRLTEEVKKNLTELTNGSVIISKIRQPAGS